MSAGRNRSNSCCKRRVLCYNLSMCYGMFQKILKGRFMAVIKLFGLKAKELKIKGVKVF
jgi:hypothetical protein